MATARCTRGNAGADGQYLTDIQNNHWTTDDKMNEAELPQNRFNGVKVFSATMAQERERLGEKITAWLRDHPGANVVDKSVTQTSDEAFHCLAITLFFSSEG